MRVAPPPGKAHWSPAHPGVLPCCGRLPFPDLTAFSPTRFIIAIADRVPRPQGHVTLEAHLVPESRRESVVREA